MTIEVIKLILQVIAKYIYAPIVMWDIKVVRSGRDQRLARVRIPY